MPTKNNSNSLLLIVLVILTFPLWFGIGGGLIGLTLGLIGGIFGIIAGIFHAILWVVLLPVHLIFGWGDWGWNGFPFFHHRKFWVIAFVIVLALVYRNRRRTAN